MNPRDYACTFKGTALLALHAWQHELQRGVQAEHVEEMMRTARMGALSLILRHITGRPEPSRWRELIRTMQEG